VEEVGDFVGVFAGMAEFLADAFVPEFGQRLGGFDAETVEVEIFLIFVGLAELLGDFGGLVADGYQLQARGHRIRRSRACGKVGDAQPAAAFLAGEIEAEDFVGVPLGVFERLAHRADEFVGAIDDQFVAIRLGGEIAVDDLGLDQLFIDGALLKGLKNRAGFFIDEFFVLGIAASAFFQGPIGRRRGRFR